MRCCTVHKIDNASIKAGFNLRQQVCSGAYLAQLIAEYRVLLPVSLDNGMIRVKLAESTMRHNYREQIRSSTV